MNDIQQKRRNAHYNTTPADDSSGHGGIKIFIQLVICMAIIFCAFYFSTQTLPTGETVRDFISQATGYDTNISVPIARLRNFIAEKAGPLLLPDPDAGSVFNETTPTKTAEP